MLAAGVTRIPVRRLPKVIIIPTGTELVPVAELDRRTGRREPAGI